MKDRSIDEYFEFICEVPEFLKKYLELGILQRLKYVGYFCGMDYASKSIYDYKYKISRFDHSLSTALLTWRFTSSKRDTLAALFHDVATPCFSHVIDYMNKDYETQESTEELTEFILSNSVELRDLLREDNLEVNEINDFKKYTIVDNNRPKLCADRLDGILLPNLAWTKELQMSEVKEIIDDITVYVNEFGEKELGFKSKHIAEKAYYLNNKVNEFCHSKEDNFMMELLASLTKYLIDKNLISYDDLFIIKESEIFEIMNTVDDEKFKDNLKVFKTVTSDEIPNHLIPNVKNRILNPLVNGNRLLELHN